MFVNVCRNLVNVPKRAGANGHGIFSSVFCWFCFSHYTVFHAWDTSLLLLLLQDLWNWLFCCTLILCALRCCQ